MSPYREPTPPPASPKFSLFRPLKVIPWAFWWFLSGGWTEKPVIHPATHLSSEYTEMPWIHVLIAWMTILGALSSLIVSLYHGLANVHHLTWWDATWICTLGPLPIRWALQSMMHLDNPEIRDWWAEKFQ